ncbi:MAG TPA: hypothetical protein VH369_18780, partial [Bryobacteraceae bacterium]
MQLYNFETGKAEALLVVPPPRAFPRLAPRYQELRGYVMLLRQQYAEGEHVLRDALSSAHSLG